MATPTQPQPKPTLLAAAATEAASLPNLLAWIALHNGHIVADHYYQGTTATTQNHIRSVTKGITSTLVGIAVDLGLIQRLDTPILDYLPEYNTPDLDPRKRTITLDHLLTMTAGFQWDELTFDAEASRQVAEWFGGGKRAALYDVLPRPLTHPPGTTFNYDSPAADLISVIFSRATGQDLRTFALEHLFGPLGITDFAWEIDPAGYYRGSAGLVMRPSDLAKIGQLYLQQGQWQGRQLVSRTWIEQATRIQIALNDGYGYGRLWWVNDNEPIRFFSGVGYGGQLLLVVPERQLVVVANHEWWNIPAEIAVKQSTAFYHQVFMKILEDTALPA